ncbi:hypothetical protein HK100_008268 [Physocladia obscura]|uniref:Lysosomal dipeptide transporter MFSD1 n=1 Tax=Physocladia obscura TaxID=109957 RepID=A0AAD5TBW4_9FUNG|nr:hypothetical protein HK100_008268 [Physocladia obscura]
MYVVYSAPNMLLPYVGGILVDRLGTRVLLLYSALSCAGQLLFAFGIHLRHIPIALLGRFLFGAGGESIVVVQGCIMANCFSGNFLTFALGLNLCVSRLGSVCNAILSPILDRYFGVEAAVMAGTTACLISFVSAISLLRILPTVPAVPLDEIPPLIQSFTGEALVAYSPSAIFFNDDEEDVAEVTSNTCPPTPSQTIIRQNFHPRRNSSYAVSFHESIPPSESTPLLFIPPNIPAPDPTPPTSCSALAMFPFAFWILCVLYVVFYGTAWCFNNTASDFLQDKWFPGDAVTAGFVMSIPDSASALLVVLTGTLIPTTTYPRLCTVLLILSFLTITICHLILGFTFANPIGPLSFLGIAYSINPVVIWPSVAIVIQRHEKKLQISQQRGDGMLGAAYGICTSGLNMILVIIPLCAAWIRVESGGGGNSGGDGWMWLEVFYAGLAGVGVCGATLLWAIDGLGVDGNGENE